MTFFWSNFWNPVCSENHIFCKEKPTFWGPFWVPKCRAPGTVFSYFLGSQVYGSMMSILGSSWGHLGPSWGHLGLSWGHLGPSWGHLGPSWGRLGVILGRLGAILGRLGAIFFHFFGFIFWNPVCSENAIICKEKPTF